MNDGGIWGLSGKKIFGQESFLIKFPLKLLSLAEGVAASPMFE